MITLLEALGVLAAVAALGFIVWLCRCDHTHARRELRQPNGDPIPVGSRQRGVLHYVCDCGYVTPVIRRTAHDAAKAKRLSKQRAPKANVVSIRRKERA